jgi:hypothetical protein
MIIPVLLNHPVLYTDVAQIISNYVTPDQMHYRKKFNNCTYELKDLFTKFDFNARCVYWKLLFLCPLCFNTSFSSIQVINKPNNTNQNQCKWIRVCRHCYYINKETITNMASDFSYTRYYGPLVPMYKKN